MKLCVYTVYEINGRFGTHWPFTNILIILVKGQWVPKRGMARAMMPPTKHYYVKNSRSASRDAIKFTNFGIFYDSFSVQNSDLYIHTHQNFLYFARFQSKSSSCIVWDWLVGRGGVGWFVSAAELAEWSSRSGRLSPSPDRFTMETSSMEASCCPSIEIRQMGQELWSFNHGTIQSMWK